jgi:hypothetical protein
MTQEAFLRSLAIRSPREVPSVYGGSWEAMPIIQIGGYINGNQKEKQFAQQSRSQPRDGTPYPGTLRL